MLRKWILAIVITTSPMCALAQVRSGVQSGVEGGVQTGVQGGLRSGVRSGYEYRYDNNSKPRYGYGYSNCWRTTVVRGTRIVWNCQPYPPP